MNSYFFKITDEEKTNILNKHKELYNGYLSVQPKVNPTRLSIYDDISDKKGFTLTNSDLIKEGRETMCSECGGTMSEGECTECGAMNENWDTEDLNLDNSMDFVENEEYMYEIHIDENKKYTPIMESFIKIAGEMNLIHKINEQVNKKVEFNSLTEELNNIKSFMIKINAY